MLAQAPRTLWSNAMEQLISPALRQPQVPSLHRSCVCMRVLIYKGRSEPSKTYMPYLSWIRKHNFLLYCNWLALKYLHIPNITMTNETLNSDDGSLTNVSLGASMPNSGVIPVLTQTSNLSPSGHPIKRCLVESGLSFTGNVTAEGTCTLSLIHISEPTRPY